MQTPLLKKTNHALVDVGLASDAVDRCEGVLPVTVNVFADEDDNGTGDGKASPWTSLALSGAAALWLCRRRISRRNGPSLGMALRHMR